MSLKKFNEFLDEAAHRPSADPRESNFHTGDNVHGYQFNKSNKFDAPDPSKVHHGVVIHHTDKHATVKWENGEVTKHHQHNGVHASTKPNKKMGETPFRKTATSRVSTLSPLVVRHNQEFRNANSPKLSNAEHKKLLLIKYNEDKEHKKHFSELMQGRRHDHDDFK